MWCIVFVQTEQAIDFLVKVENLKELELETKEKYSLILASYAKDLDSVRKTYQKQKSDPVVPRNLPPIAGKWLYFSGCHAHKNCYYIFYMLNLT